ncbi:MAG: DUF4830 domain-containing protein, partial [Oscillospiraceae bacterium]
MFAASVGKKQLGKVIFLLVIVVVVGLVAITVIGKIKDKKDASADIMGETAEQRVEYLLSLGVQVDTTSAVAEVLVPKEFDERFIEYNTMLLSTGFDLSSYKGETVKKCTFTVTNKPEMGANVKAVLLVHEGKIIAGHLLDATSAKIYPIYQVSSPPAEETILPQAAAQTSGVPSSETETSAELKC